MWGRPLLSEDSQEEENFTAVLTIQNVNLSQTIRLRTKSVKSVKVPW